MSFTVGQQGELNGIEWRVVTGRKKPGDLRLEIRAMEFRAVPMSLGFLFADFHYQVEDHLYPPADGYLGGKKYLQGLRGAVTVGWEAAKDWLEEERRRKPAAALRETTETESPLLGSSPVVSQSALSERDVFTGGWPPSRSESASGAGDALFASKRGVGYPAVTGSAVAPSSGEDGTGDSDPSLPVRPAEPEQLALGLPGSVYRKKEAA